MTCQLATPSWCGLAADTVSAERSWGYGLFYTVEAEVLGGLQESKVHRRGKEKDVRLNSVKRHGLKHA